MAHNNNQDASRNDSNEESIPLLNNQAENEKQSNVVDGKAFAVVPPPQISLEATANGLPLGHRSVMGESMGRTQWDSSLCACLGRND